MVPVMGQQTSELELSLANLEDALETPIVSGELTEWCERVHGGFESFRDTYMEEARRSHVRQLAQIGEQDQEMGAVVTQLREEDEAILVELERLGTVLQVYAEHIDPHAEGSDEAISEEDTSSEQERRSLVQELLALVIRIRMQEKALQTWFVEAFQRDRGVGD